MNYKPNTGDKNSKTITLSLASDKKSIYNKILKNISIFTNRFSYFFSFMNFMKEAIVYFNIKMNFKPLGIVWFINFDEEIYATYAFRSNIQAIEAIHGYKLSDLCNFLYKFICNIIKTEDIQIFLSFSVKLFSENRLVKLLKLLLFNVNLANPVQKNWYIFWKQWQ